MRLLAVETATEACSAALFIEGEIVERYRLAPRKHAELILSMVDELMADAGLGPRDLDAIAFGRGPGSFTGLRIAAGVVQGIAFGADLPVVPISSLAALAQGAMDEHHAPRVLAVLDARMGEIYWGAYICDSGGLAGLQGEERVGLPQEVEVSGKGPWTGTGSGCVQYQALLETVLSGRMHQVISHQYPRAAHVARLGVAAFAAGQVVTPERAVPHYLRNQVARKPGENSR